MKKIKLSPTRVLVIGFSALILLGTLLLMLPISTRSGESAGFLDSLFTATSATCVTGLIIHDTYTFWSLFGQLVIMILIQIGGLGFMTLAISIVAITKRKIGLRERYTLQESMGAPQVGGIVRLSRLVLYGTIIFEGAGVILLSFTFIPQLGFAEGLYFAVFHSISAFCNAGFDLMGKTQQFSSLTAFVSDPLVNIVIMALIVIGGLGFFVWVDMFHNKFKFKNYKLHTKIVLITTAILIIGATILIYIFEFSGPAYGNKSESDKFLISAFQAVTPRTAGFNTVDLPSLRHSTQMLMICLMLIGGSPGSTAGGVKTTTFAVLFLSIFSEFRRKKSIQCFRRRLDSDLIRHACCVFIMYLVLFVASSLVISAIDNVPMNAVMFETASAIGTVGLSLGITPGLSVISHLILSFLMFFGRVGALTLLFALSKNYPSAPSELPMEKITIG